MKKVADQKKNLHDELGEEFSVKSEQLNFIIPGTIGNVSSYITSRLNQINSSE